VTAPASSLLSALVGGLVGAFAVTRLCGRRRARPDERDGAYGDLGSGPRPAAPLRVN